MKKNLTPQQAGARCIMVGTGCAVAGYLMWKIVTAFVPHPPLMTQISASLFVLIMIASTVMAVVHIHQKSNAPRAKRMVHKTRNAIWLEPLELAHPRGFDRN